MSLRIGQIIIDQDFDLGGKNIVNVGGLTFVGAGSLDPNLAPVFTTLAVDMFARIGRQDASTMLLQAAAVENDNRLRTFTYSGQFLSGLLEQSGAVTVKNETRTPDLYGRVAQSVETLRMPNGTTVTATTTFSYNGNTEQIAGISRVMS